MTVSGPGAPETPPRRKRIPAALFAQGVPLWMTLLTLALGAFGTYYLAPRVNAQIEAQKLRTSFVVENLAELRSETGTLLAAIALFNQDLRQRKDVGARFNDLLASISKLQGQAISLYFVLSDAASQKVMAEYQTALVGVMQAAATAADQNADQSKETEDVLAESLKGNERFIRATVNLFAAIGELGGLRTISQQDLGGKKPAAAGS